MNNVLFCNRNRCYIIVTKLLGVRNIVKTQKTTVFFGPQPFSKQESAVATTRKRRFNKAGQSPGERI